MNAEFIRGSLFFLLFASFGSVAVHGAYLVREVVANLPALWLHSALAFALALMCRLQCSFLEGPNCVKPIFTFVTFRDCLLHETQPSPLGHTVAP